MTWVYGEEGEMTVGEGAVTVGTDTRISWYVRSAPERIVWMVAGRDRRVVERLGNGLTRMLVKRDMKAISSLIERDWDTGMWTLRGSVAAEYELAVKLEDFRARVELGRRGEG